MAGHRERPDPPRAPSEDKALYAHYADVIDALSEEYSDPVTTKTSLAALYLYSNPGVDNRLLKNLVGVCDIKFLAQMLIGPEGVMGSFPSSVDKPGNTFILRLTFNKLIIAPAVRLEVDFFDQNCANHRPYHKVALEFPFNKRDGKQLYDYKYSGQDDRVGWPSISFTTTGASCEGFSMLSTLEHRLSPADKQLLDVLRSLLKPGEQQELRFLLQTHEIAEHDLAELRKITERLPGGSRPLLPSIGVKEYAGYQETLAFIRNPHFLMTTTPGNMMVPLHCGDTFASLTHWRVENWWASAMSHWEGQVSLRRFAAGKHKVAIYKKNKVPILAMQFGEMPSIGRGDKILPFRLPNDLEVVVTLFIPGLMRVEERITAVHTPHQPGLPKHDAYFVITSHRLRFFRNHVHDTDTANPVYISVRSIEPHENSFLLTSLEKTVNDLELPRNKNWRSIALNQSYDALEVVDIVAGINVQEGIKDMAERWLMNCISWNAEQKEVLKLLKGALGKLGICTGIAGTGKTTLQMAMAIFFVLLGGRSACFATANANADTQAKTLNELASNIEVLGRRYRRLRIYRIFSASQILAFKDMSDAQASHRRTGHKNGNVSNIHGLKAMILDQSVQQMPAWQYSIEQGVIEEAAKGELHWPARIDRDNQAAPVDVWVKFQQFWTEDLEGRFDWKNETRIAQYDRAYEACKGYLIGHADIVITTNGNAHCKELVNHWSNATDPELYKQKITCLGVFIDEVAKEQELHVWNSILSPGLPMKPNFVLLLGDPKQLAPVNTCSTGELQFNPFAQRCDISLIDRLLRGGFPCIHLKQQQRMHPCLSYFPNRESYGGELENGPGTERDLEDVEPGLKPILDDIIAKSYQTEAEQIRYRQEATDEQSRLHYLDFGVKKRTVNHKRSIAIPEHIDKFFELVFPALQGHFQDRMSREVMVITAYGHAIGLWKDHIYDLKQSQGRDDSYYPRVLTIDASQGQEATMVVMDASFDYRDRITKHMKDAGRCNVAMTRAKEVYWMIGGPLGVERSYNATAALSPFPKLKLKHLEPNGQVHSFY